MARKTLQAIAKSLPVTDFADYRDYLAELYTRAKAETSPYSYEQFAEDLGFSAINMVRLVIVRQRLLAPKSAQTIARTLGLHREERRYFLALVGHINAKSPELKARYFQKMLDAKQGSLVSHKDRDQIEFLREWYHSVVIEMLRLNAAKADPQWLADQLLPNVGPEKIKHSLGLLEAVGLVVRNPQTGELQAAGPQVVVPANATTAHLAMTQHHKSMLDAAKEALDAVPAQQREFNALTINVSLETFERIRDRLRDVCAEILQTESQQQPRECVAQLNIGFFTMTKWEGNGS